MPKNTEPRLSSPTGLMTAKLASSGLTPEDGKILKLSALTAEQTVALSPTFRASAALKIPYFDAKGKTTDFYRIRYLESQLGFTKELRYTQPPGSGMQAYLPPLFNWDELGKDPGCPILITEGEFKAAAGCKAGMPTIGLGGVFNWKSSKAGVRFLPELEDLVLRGREVYILFDSDAKQNPMVGIAAQQLSKELVRHGAKPAVAVMPEVSPGQKTGLDDYLLVHSYEDLQELLTTATTSAASAALWGFNSEVVYIFDPGLVVVQASGQKLSPDAFKSHAYVNRTIMDDSGERPKIVSLPNAWLRWPHRYQLDRLVYMPGEKSVHEQQWNLWPGWGCDPTPGDTELWELLLDHLFVGAEPWARQWFERWLAYPLQYPGTKLFTSVLMWGRDHGTGKSLVGYVMGLIYGKNFTEIGEGDLANSFNEWAQHKQFALGDDVTSHDNRGQAEQLKKMITQKTMRINAKFMPSYEIKDCLNYYFTANGPDAFFLEDRDRRAFVNQVLSVPLIEEFYADFMLWLDKGASHVFHRLLNLDLGDFNPSAPAPRTGAKERMIVTTKSELAAWCHMLATEPDSVLRMGQKVLKHELMSAAQLLTLFDPDGRTKTTSQGMGRELLKAGLHQLCQGKVVRDRRGDISRLYVVREQMKWAEIGADIERAEEILDQLDRQAGVAVVPKFVPRKKGEPRPKKILLSRDGKVEELPPPKPTPLRKPSYE